MEVVSYPEEKGVMFAGVSTNLAALEEDEVRAFVEQIDTIISEASPAVAAIIRGNIDVLLNLVRRVKTETKLPFVGAKARGKQLTILLGRSAWFLKNNAAITTWLFAATAGIDWFISGAADAAIILPEEEGFAFLGWADPIEVPKAVAVQLEKGADPHVPESLCFDLCSEFPVHKLKEPWVIQPEDNYRIQVRYNVTGDDKLMPIVFRVCMAESVMTI